MGLDLGNIRRVCVVGASGCGKSVFSRRLAEILDVPHVPMDALYWGPAWTPKPREEFLASIQDVTSKEAWVLDGNYTFTEPLKWPRAQLVVWLDPGLPTVMWRSIRRSFSRCLSREELWLGTGNRETFRHSFFSRDSVILWTLKSFRPLRKRYAELMMNTAGPPVIRLDRRADVLRILEDARRT